jgi:hypothetical protein
LAISKPEAAKLEGLEVIFALSLLAHDKPVPLAPNVMSSVSALSGRGAGGAIPGGAGIRSDPIGGGGGNIDFALAIEAIFRLGFASSAISFSLSSWTTSLAPTSVADTRTAPWLCADTNRELLA